MGYYHWCQTTRKDSTVIQVKLYPNVIINAVIGEHRLNAADALALKEIVEHYIIGSHNNAGKLLKTADEAVKTAFEQYKTEFETWKQTLTGLISGKPKKEDACL